MKFVDEYRDPKFAQQLSREIHRITTRPWVLMEVCGGQTHAIVKFGIDELLPKFVELVHGPGCPVCVTPLELIDKAIAIASQGGRFRLHLKQDLLRKAGSSRPEVIFCSFGDMLRVPGSTKDLFSVKAEGGDIRIVYSPMDAL